MSRLPPSLWATDRLCALGQKKDGDSARDNHVLALTLPNIHRLSNKPFLMWLLTTPPHFKYVATLPSNLSLMAYFADINVSPASVATYARCGGIFDIRLTANLARNLPVKKNS